MMDFCEEIIAEVQNQFKLDYLRFKDFHDEDTGIHKITATDPLRNRRKIYCLDSKVINESLTIPIDFATQLSYQNDGISEMPWTLRLLRMRPGIQGYAG